MKEKRLELSTLKLVHIKKATRPITEFRKSSLWRNANEQCLTFLNFTKIGPFFSKSFTGCQSIHRFAGSEPKKNFNVRDDPAEFFPFRWDSTTFSFHLTGARDIYLRPCRNSANSVRLPQCPTPQDSSLCVACMIMHLHRPSGSRQKRTLAEYLWERNLGRTDRQTDIRRGTIPIALRLPCRRGRRNNFLERCK